jgi:hypothetical protein
MQSTYLAVYAPGRRRLSIARTLPTVWFVAYRVQARTAFRYSREGSSDPPSSSSLVRWRSRLSLSSSNSMSRVSLSSSARDATAAVVSSFGGMGPCGAQPDSRTADKNAANISCLTLTMESDRKRYCKLYGLKSHHRFESIESPMGVASCLAGPSPRLVFLDVA